MDIAKTCAIVTGGASGLGAATMRALRQGGAQVCIFDLDANCGTALAQETGCTFACVDVTQEDAVKTGV